jgi:hypothetical protein
MSIHTARAARLDVPYHQLARAGLLRQRHHRHQAGPRHEIRIIERGVRPGQSM